MTKINIRKAIAGDISRAVVFYFELYEKQFNFNGSVEKYFMGAALELFDDAENSGLWVAVQDEKVVGSIAIVGKGNGEAQLRLFGVEPNLQGHGIGKKLMDTAMNFCAEKNFTHIILWTIDILKPALHVYEKYGFRHTEDKPNNEWASYPMIEQKYEWHK